MKKVFIINKKEGETPLQALEKFRALNKKYKDEKLTYAGRLDPMAEGLLIILLGEEVKEKQKYLEFDKEYEFEILFGFATDTYDILGKVLAGHTFKDVKYKNILEAKVKENLKHFIGNFNQTYPLYSSKTIKHARSGSKASSPSHDISVHKLQFLKLRTIKANTLLKNIEKRIEKVQGDFRQKEILKIWHKNLMDKIGDAQFFIGSFKIKCGSGTYVRGIADALGQKIGIPALAFSIKRTKIGKWRQRS